jgi:hypothetical protein
MSTRPAIVTFAAVTLTALVVVCACGSGGSNGGQVFFPSPQPSNSTGTSTSTGASTPTTTSVPTGTAAFAVTGATFNSGFPARCFTEATVQIRDIGLHLQSNPPEVFTTVVGPSQTFNLLDLQNVSETAGEGPVPAGTYDVVRFNIVQGVLTFAGTAGPSLPFSPTANGLVLALLNSPLTVQEGEVSEVLIDIDVGETFSLPAGTPPVDCPTLAASSSLFMFTPTVRVINVGVTTGRTGATTIVTGTVVSQTTGTGVGGATVSAVDTTAGNGLTAPVTTLTTGEGTTGAVPGSFVMFLPSGTFTLTIGIPGSTDQNVSLVIPPGTTTSNLGTIIVP